MPMSEQKNWTVKLDANEMARAKTRATALQEFTKNFATTNSGSKDSELIGAMGELGFGKIFNEPCHWVLSHDGDAHMDYRFGPLRVDIKSVKYKGSDQDLILRGNVYKGANQNDILVLAQVSKYLHTVRLIGWHYTSFVRRAPTGVLPPATLLEWHMVHEEELLRIEDLAAIIMNIRWLNRRGQ